MKPLEAYFIRLLTVIVATMPSGKLLKYHCQQFPFHCYAPVTSKLQSDQKLSTLYVAPADLLNRLP